MTLFEGSIHRRARRSIALFTTATTLGLVGVATQPAISASASPVTVHDGRSSTNAAPSCWAIKKSFPSSRDGVYWLLTAKLRTPHTFYCDMTTNGGGWVMIGRGREGWNWEWAGQGSPNAIVNAPTGPRAFAPATLSATTITALTNGKVISSMSDGLRLRRAADIYGASWQEVRLHYAYLRGFTWMMDGGQPLTTASFDTVSRKVGPTGHISTGSTFDVRFDSAKMFMHTGSRPSHFNLLGWAYGPTVRGINVKSSYLWSGVNFAGYALPFTQVFLRPMLSDATAGFRTIPNAGLPAAPRPVLPSSIPQHLDWGVRNVRIASDDPDSMGNSPVLGLAQIGNTLYVGGKFQTVQHFSTGGTAHQPWLAAFDIRSGTWISGFHPTLDGAVFDLIAAPDGTLLVGGNFTNINGAVHTAGLAKLDPATGAVVAGWNASLTGARFAEQHSYARAIDVRGPWVYVAGGFNGVDGGPSSTALAAGGAARVSLADGTPDITWHPFFDFAPSDIIGSADGNRVYVSGAFNHIGVSNVMNMAAIGFAILRADDATGVTGLGPVHLNNPGHPEQLAVTEYGSEVFHGGNQHWLASYDSSAFDFRNGASMGPRGDVQAIAGMYGFVFAGCHCLGYSLHVPAVGQADRVDRLNWMGAWNPTTFDRVEAFEPQWTMAGTGEGVWRIMADSDNCMWTASDVIQGATTSDHLGGIARFCPGDTTAPSVPRMVKRIGTKLVWAASTDNAPGPLRYEILRNDRVVAVTTTRAFTPKTHGRYFIRAIDSAGNIGPTTRVINS